MALRSFFNHVVIKTTILVLLLTGCQTKSIRHEIDIYCDPQNHLYYVEQIPGCKECDRCWSGQEPDLQGVDLGMGLNGSTKCPKCRQCSEGTYNPDGDVYWKCLTCTKCSDLGLYEDQPCTTKQDTLCSKNDRNVQKRLITSSDSYESVHVGQKQEDEDLHNEKVKDVSVSVVVTAVVMTLIVFAIAYKRKRLRKCLWNQNASTPEENMPLKEKETVQVGTDDTSENADVRNPEEAGDQLRDIRRNEKTPLVPKRTRHVSFGDYDNNVFGVNVEKDGEKDGEETHKKQNPAFRRQLSQPGTNTEEKQIQYILEKEDEKKRPSESFIRHLSKVLAPKQRYKVFAEHMDLEAHQMELLKEEHEQPHRTLNVEDISFEYISMSLQRKKDLAHSDVYNALRKLELHKELANVVEKRRRRRI